MSMITVTQKGDIKKTIVTIKKMRDKKLDRILDKYGSLGVEELAKATPKDTGKTADSWGYKCYRGENRATIVWTNSNTNKYANVAVLIQYGHATKNGGWVEGIDYINPAMKPVFEKIAKKAWAEVVESE